MPTLVTVPATTGPKSQDTGPEVLLMELPALCAETVCVGLKSANIRKPRRMTRAKTAVERILLDSGMDFALGEEGGVDMVSPEFKRFGRGERVQQCLDDLDEMTGSSSTTAKT